MELPVQPVLGLGLTALRTMPVVARVVGVVVVVMFWTNPELTAPLWRSARQDRVQDLPLPGGHGRTPPFQIRRSPTDQNLMKGQRAGRRQGLDGGHEQPGRLEIAHEGIQAFLVLGLAKAGQVRITRGDHGAAMSQVDL